MKSRIDALEVEYAPIIIDILNSNKKYFGFSNEIKWEFFVDECVANVAKNTNYSLFINVLAVEHAYNISQPYIIELFVLHEIRHIYQKMSIDVGISSPLIEQWNYEFKNYIAPTPNNLSAYYDQSIEFDAFCFSYSLMQFKYGKIDYIDYPKHYIGKIEPHINKWLEVFKNI